MKGKQCSNRYVNERRLRRWTVERRIESSSPKRIISAQLPLCALEQGTSIYFPCFRGLSRRSCVHVFPTQSVHIQERTGYSKRAGDHPGLMIAQDLILPFLKTKISLNNNLELDYFCNMFIFVCHYFVCVLKTASCKTFYVSISLLYSVILKKYYCHDYGQRS